MNRPNALTMLFSMGLLIVAALILGADVQFQDLNNGNDPVVDISLKNGPANSVYAAWGDYDLDGDEDLYVVNDGSPNHLYRNNTCSYEVPCESVGALIALSHPTSFTKMTVGLNPGLAVLRDGISSSRFAHWIDYDQDGDLDLYLVNDGMNRLFINELFDPSKPYDPFSVTVNRQAIKFDSFSYKAHPEITGALSSVDIMQVVTKVSNTVVDFPLVGTPDIFEDTSLDFLQITPKIVPGMYLQVDQPANFRGRIYTILEVLGANQLRLDYEEDLPSVTQYSILRDTKSELFNIERFLNQFNTDGTIISNSLVYEYSGSDTTFNLVERQIFDGDQVILNSVDKAESRTLSNLIQVDAQSFTVSPPTQINGQTLTENFEMNVRRRGGEILAQKIINDFRVGFPIQNLVKGDEIEIVSGVNKGRRYKIDEFFQNQVMFLESGAGTEILSATNEEFEYELIYNGISSKTRRIFTDRGVDFGPVNNESQTRQVKVGDHIIINPGLNIATNNLEEANDGRSLETLSSTRTTFDNGTARPVGVLEVKEIIQPLPGSLTSNQVVVDAFPSEVIRNYRNKNFPYQIRHRFGQLQKDALTGDLKFFTEVSPIFPTARDFSNSLGMTLLKGNPSNPLIIISDVSNTIRTPLTIKPSVYKFVPIDGLTFNRMELAVAVDPAVAQKTTNLEYRPIYIGLGAIDPYEIPQGLRIFGTGVLPPSIEAGHFLVLSGFVDTNGQSVRLNRVIKIIEAVEQNDTVDLTLSENMPDELRTNFQTLCAVSENCDELAPTNFFSQSENQLSVRYEFVATNTLQAGNELDLDVSGEVAINTEGLDYNFLFLTAGDNLEYKDPLTGSLRSSEILTISSSTSLILSNVNAIVAPFNQDIPLGVTGFKPIYRGLLTDFRLITSSNPALNFTSIANQLDKVAFFSVVPNQGLSLVARVEIGLVTPTFIQLRRRLTLDPTLQSIDAADFQTDPFYFRITRTSGQSLVRGTFKDSRQGLDFSRSLSLNPDGSIRGNVLLDLYINSTSVRDPLYKRFTLKDILSTNRIGLESGAVNENTDIFNNYYYEISELKRDQGGILENHTGNGRKVEFADWNKDGVKDIYILNSGDNADDQNVNDPNTQALTQNSSQMLYGTTQLGISTGFSFIEPVISPADNENELRNLRSDINQLTVPLEPRAVLSNDLNNDLEPDLYILNVDENDKLLLSGVSEGLVNRELNSNDENELLFEPILGENDVLIGDVNKDGIDDIYYLVGRNPNLVAAAITGVQTPTTNVLFLASVDADGTNLQYTRRALPILNTNIINMESGYSLSGAIIDYNNDSYPDINVMNNDLIYIAETRFEGANSIGGNNLVVTTRCGISGAGYNRHIAWSDVNMDGWPDFYVSRASESGETNALCLAVPDKTDVDSNNFFIVELLPRNLTGRVDKKIKAGRVTLNYIDQGSQQRFSFQRFEYNYPFPTIIKFSTGPIKEATFIVQWSDQHDFNYGSFKATNIAGKRIKLEQPGDYYIINNKHLQSVKSSPLSSIQTIVGPQTTNIEATGFSVMAGRREPVVLETLSVFINAGQLFEDPAEIEAGFIPRGSIKLFLDASEVDQGSDDFKNFTPDGEYNLNHDVEIASAPLVIFNPSGGPNIANQAQTIRVYNEILDNKGLRRSGDTIELGVQFRNLAYRSRDGQTLTSFVLNPAIAGGRADKLSFLVVYTSDIKKDTTFADPRVTLQVLPYLPTRLYQGALNTAIALGDDNTQILKNPFEQSFEIEFRGQRSTQLNRGILLDSTKLSSNSISDFSTYPASNLPILSGNVVGLISLVDKIVPTAPVLDSAVIKKLKEDSVLLFGTAEPLTTIRIINETNGSEPILTQVNADGTWQILVTDLSEGSNNISLVSIDFYGNESLATVAILEVDLTPPNIIEEIVTNIGIATATITWKTNESAVSTIILTSSSIANLEQIFLEPNQFLFRKDHSIVVGKANSLFSGLDLTTSPPIIPSPQNCQLRTNGIPVLSALCPDTTYNVTIEVRDALGNANRLNNILSFTTLQASDSPKDVNGDGVIDLADQDSDGDGIPDSIEGDSVKFPDLDMFDGNDSLLDFDGDGINNVEEFKNGSDMYNPFDALPIANAGTDLTVDPGIIILDSSGSNQNGIATNNLDFRWTMESAPNQRNIQSPPSPPEIDAPNQRKTFFSARKAGNYVISLQILTLQGAESKKDTVTYSVRNKIPQANAGIDGIGKIFEDIILDGRSSSDSNGDPLTFRWIQLQGPNLTNQGEGFGIEDATKAKTKFRTNRTGKYVFELIVRDNFNALSRDQVTILVNSAVDVFPIADAGTDVVATQNQPISLQADKSGGLNASSKLEYSWELITTVTQDVPEECENFRTTSVNSVIPQVSNLKNPTVNFSQPGLYAFKLTVRELGKGLESTPDCIKVVVNKTNEILPISRPQILGEPVRLADKLTGNITNVNPSLGKVAQEAVMIYRVPINFEVQMSGLDSYPGHDVIASRTSASFNQVNQGDDCLDANTAYSWRQITGDELKLFPVVTDCSVVTFTPIHVGIYTFALKVKNLVDGTLLEGLERTLVILANDNFNEEENDFTLGVENNFIPTIVAPEGVVQLAGGNLSLSSPQCMDQDLMPSASTEELPFGPNTIPVNELRSCAASAPLSCVWNQVNGPALNIEDSNVCVPTFLNIKEGTYTVAVRAFDGVHYSLPSETTFMAIGIGHSPPQADAGNDLAALVNEQVVLNGGLSIADSFAFEYIWNQVGGMPVVLKQSRTVSPSFLPVAEDTYQFELQVQDSKGLRSLPDRVEVFVRNTSQSNLNEVPVGEVSDPIEIGKAFEQQGGGGGGGCFIVTATSGSKDSWLVNFYTELRDNVLMQYDLGRYFVELYYKYSPPVADLISRNQFLRLIFAFILYPLALVLQFPLFILLLALFMIIVGLFKKDRRLA